MQFVLLIVCHIQLYRFSEQSNYSRSTIRIVLLEVLAMNFVTSNQRKIAPYIQ